MRRQQPLVRRHVLRIKSSLGLAHILGKYETREEAIVAAARTDCEVIGITEEDVQLDY